MSKTETLEQTVARLEKEKAELKERAENAEKRVRSESKLYARVAEKGGISVYGFGQWPITLYASQWRKFLEYLPEFVTFLCKAVKDGKGPGTKDTTRNVTHKDNVDLKALITFLTAYQGELGGGKQ